MMPGTGDLAAMVDAPQVQFYNGKPQLIGKIASGAQGAPFAFCLFDSALEVSNRR